MVSCEELKIFLEIFGLGLAIIGQALLLKDPQMILWEPAGVKGARYEINQKYPKEQRMRTLGIFLTMLGFVFQFLGIVL